MPLSPQVYARLLRRAIFDCCKWQVQAEDRPILCPFPLVLDEATWTQLAGLAAALARETLAAEQELLHHTDLHDRLGLPDALRRHLLAIPKKGPSHAGVRVTRYDFHWTSNGWAISEANTDVAGGFIEASGVTALLSQHYPNCRPAGDPAGVLSEAVLRREGLGATVGLMHLTVYSEDRQVMLYLGRRLEENGLSPLPFSPVQLRWERGQAAVVSRCHSGKVDHLIRFFPAEWLPRLPARTGWAGLVVGGQTGVCNPAYAVLTQSKRFPLTWDQLSTPLPTWRALLPETISPREVSGVLKDGWVLKPALGHEGSNVAIYGVTKAQDWGQICNAAIRKPASWVAQRRFDSPALLTPDGHLYPCLGVFVIDGKVAGAYGRMGLRPLIDDQSRDVVVLVRKSVQKNAPVSENQAHAT